MKSEFRFAYLQYVGVRVGGSAIGIDYQSTIYQVSGQKASFL